MWKVNSLVKQQIKEGVNVAIKQNGVSRKGAWIVLCQGLSYMPYPWCSLRIALVSRF